MERYHCANQSAKPQACFVSGEVEKHRVAQKGLSVGRFVIY